ncbi:creatininase [Anopheles sinensis]|uniref:Creatininase n=1 Tax=Anopheles sinensis TaxID=74873 RepID=A0A084VVQ4_ANOSI|nr:creatininase [Anopheles sinensis]
MCLKRKTSADLLRGRDKIRQRACKERVRYKLHKTYPNASPTFRRSKDVGAAVPPKNVWRAVGEERWNDGVKHKSFGALSCAGPGAGATTTIEVASFPTAQAGGFLLAEEEKGAGFYDYHSGVPSNPTP